MKKLLLMAALTLGLAAPSWAQTDLRSHTSTDSLVTSNFAIKPGGTHDIYINLINPSSYTVKGITVKLNLPDGIKIRQRTTSSGATRYSVSVCNGEGERLDQDEVEFTATTGTAAIVLVSLAGDDLPGHEGNVLKVTLEADADVAEGVYHGNFDGSGITTDGAERSQRDANGKPIPWEYLVDNVGTFTITVTNDPTGIKNVTVGGTKGRIYDIDGYEVKNPVKGRIYVIDGKKQIYK